MSAAKGIEVTVRDLATGEAETRTVWNDYILICAGSCHESSVQTLASGTHQITVKGVGGEPRRAAAKRWRSRLRGMAPQ